MSAGIKTTGTGGLIMKAEQSSIYRTIELLMLGLVPTSARVPRNNPILERLMTRMTDEFVDALTATSMALKSASLQERSDLLDLLSLHIENIDTCVRTMYEWSSTAGQTVRLVSKKQYAQYLKTLHSVYRQLGGWQKATSEKLQSHA